MAYTQARRWRIDPRTYLALRMPRSQHSSSNLHCGILGWRTMMKALHPLIRDVEEPSRVEGIKTSTRPNVRPRLKPPRANAAVFLFNRPRKQRTFAKHSPRAIRWHAILAIIAGLCVSGCAPD